MRNQQEIVTELVSNWVSLALEYATGASGVDAVFVYVSSEEGESTGNVFFRQNGEVNYPSKLVGVDASNYRIAQAQRLIQTHLFEAEADFAAIGVPCPTEYRVYFEPTTKKLDVQLSHEIKYANHPTKTSVHGPEDWLDRLPKVHGKYLPKDGK